MRVRAGIIFTVIVVSVVAVVGALLVGNVRMFRFGPSIPSTATAHAAPGTKAAFTYLAAQTSSNCTLQPATVKSYPDNVRIQGSCCSPMDWDHYREQVRDLRRYHAIAAIPADPYNVPAALAKALVAYGDSIRLTQAQQRVYRRAMSITPRSVRDTDQRTDLPGLAARLAHARCASRRRGAGSSWYSPVDPVCR